MVLSTTIQRHGTAFWWLRQCPCARRWWRRFAHFLPQTQVPHEVLKLDEETAQSRVERYVTLGVVQVNPLFGPVGRLLPPRVRVLVRSPGCRLEICQASAGFCSDSDALTGQPIKVRGTTTGPYRTEEGLVEFGSVGDACVSTSEVAEYSCDEDGFIRRDVLSCGSTGVCDNGACVVCADRDEDDITSASFAINLLGGAREHDMCEVEGLCPRSYVR